MVEGGPSSITRVRAIQFYSIEAFTPQKDVKKFAYFKFPSSFISKLWQKVRDNTFLLNREKDCQRGSKLQLEPGLCHEKNTFVHTTKK